MMTNLIGKSLGRYHILEQLGEGGMAVVYKAYDTRLEAEVAVKVIRTDNILPRVLERAVKRFDREAKALAKLTHANIVKVIDYGEYEGNPYLVMPYLPGGTLKERLKGKPMPWQEAARLIIPIARALDFAHRQGLIHRDVKPSNIIITADGDPMLTDFGIAKILELEETVDLTGTNAAVGTPEYMAPEQSTSNKIDHRADIYALGVVFYEMVAGRKPYIADTPMAVLIKHASEPLPRPRQFESNLPQVVENILLKALAKNPNDRYQNMSEFAAALENLSSKKSPRLETRKLIQQYVVVGTLMILTIFTGGYYLLKNKPMEGQENTPQNSLLTTSTKQIVPTPTTVIEKTPTGLTNIQAGYYDDFQNPAFDGGFDPGKWSIGQESSGTTEAIQRDGMFILSDSMPTSGQGLILTFRGWTASTFNFFEAKIKVDNVSGENGNITMNVNSPSIPVGWKEFGLTAYSDLAKAFVAGTNGNIAEKNIKKDTWYTLKIVFNRDDNTLIYFIDGEQFSTYKVPSKVTALTPMIQLWHPTGSYFSGAVDEIKIGN